MQQIHELRPGLYTLDTVQPGLEVRAVIIIGDRQAVVWDTLTVPAAMASLHSLLGAKPFHVIYSHADWDHIWGTQGFVCEPQTVVAHEECLRRFSDDVPQTLLDMQAETSGKWDDIQLLPPRLTFRSRLELDLGGVMLELHHLPGHTEDCIVGWLPQWGVLTGGDAIESPLPVVNDGASVAGWLRALEVWAENPAVKTTIPSHGSTAGRDCLDMTVDYLRRLQNGDDFAFRSDLAPFYQQTHKKNLELVRGANCRDD